LFFEEDQGRVLKVDGRLPGRRFGMKAVDVMTLGATTIRSDASIAEAARLMLDHGISGLPVVDLQGDLVGIVTETDFLRRSEAGTERHRAPGLELMLGPGRLAAEYVRSHGRTISEVMTRKVVSVVEDTPVDEIVRLMERHHVKRVPVLHDNRIIGIVSRANLVRALAQVVAEVPPPHGQDRTIRKRILAELQREAWASTTRINVLVRNGMVQLWGTITDERQRQALRVAAENVPGTKWVEDYLVLVEPSPSDRALP
jgi:CBS domain-containing protein